MSTELPADRPAGDPVTRQAAPALRLWRRARGILVNVYWWWRVAPESAVAYLRNLSGERRYRVLSERQLRATRTSDTAFIFGSGYSINDITPAEWQGIARANTISFNDFPRQHFVRADYHIVGEIYYLEEHTERIRTNPLYDNTVFLVQGGWRGYRGNDVIGRGLLRPGARLFRYLRTERGRAAPPSESFSDGVVHAFGSVMSATNIAYMMGFRTIVLAGVDLYDRRYFWLGPDQTLPYEKPGLTHESKFTNADEMVELFDRWRDLLKKEGVELAVFNPRSLLARALPVYDRSRLSFLSTR